MSIYSEHEHGYITDEEFRSAAYREYAADKEPTEPEGITGSDVVNCLYDEFCTECERDECIGEACPVDRACKAVE